VPVPVPHDKLAQALVSYEHTGNAAQTARDLAMPESTVRSILSKRYRWGEVLADPFFGELRREQKKAFQVAALDLARKSLAKAEEKIDNASYLQLVTGYGILRDKERLDAGESTANISLHTTNDADDLDKVAARASRALLKRRTTK